MKRINFVQVTKTTLMTVQTLPDDRVQFRILSGSGAVTLNKQEMRQLRVLLNRQLARMERSDPSF